MRHWIWQRMPGRRRRHDFGLPHGRSRVSHLGKQDRQVHVLELGRPAAGQAMVQVLPGPGQRLMPSDRLVSQPLAVGPGHAGQQLLIEHVAIGRDLRHQHAQRGRRGMRFRPAAAGGRGHQDGAGQHAGRFEQQFVAPDIRVLRRPGTAASSVTCCSTKRR